MEVMHNTGTGANPNTKGTTTTERNWAMLLHISTYSYFVINFLGFAVPFVLWIMKKEESRFIDQHGKAVLNFSLTLALMALSVIVVGFVLTLAGIITFPLPEEGFSPLSIGLAALAFLVAFAALIAILPLFGIRAALKGEAYRYPLAFSFFK